NLQIFRLISEGGITSEMNGAFQSKVAMLQTLYGERLLRAKILKARKMLIEHFFKPSKLGISCPQKHEIHRLAEGHPYNPDYAKRR
ncbi:MAG: hypothetical protein IK999_15670, partial [Ruminococcus sp.]|nr:hypothetical protein [Ruminococcus sp.]